MIKKQVCEKLEVEIKMLKLMQEHLREHHRVIKRASAQGENNIQLDSASMHILKFTLVLSRRRLLKAFIVKRVVIS
jgi:REP element-mobilizing transposase RayT